MLPAPISAIFLRAMGSEPSFELRGRVPIPAAPRVPREESAVTAPA
jgi:hypothetical protein